MLVTAPSIGKSINGIVMQREQLLKSIRFTALASLY
jgi:hypothetical protein